MNDGEKKAFKRNCTNKFPQISLVNKKVVGLIIYMYIIYIYIYMGTIFIEIKNRRHLHKSAKMVFPFEFLYVFFIVHLFHSFLKDIYF